MKLPSTLIQDSFLRPPLRIRNWDSRGGLDSGFTLIETLIVIGIIGFLAVVGIIAGIDTYSRHIFRSDLDKTAALLQKARSSAINNINEKSYGVYLGDADNLILFSGTSYDPSLTFNYKLERSKTATSTNTCAGNQVVFSQLTGNTVGCEIVIKDGDKVATTTINSQGGINY